VCEGVKCQCVEEELEAAPRVPGGVPVCRCPFSRRRRAALSLLYGVPVIIDRDTPLKNLPPHPFLTLSPRQIPYSRADHR